MTDYSKKIKVDTKDHGVVSIEHKEITADLLLHKMSNLIGDSGSGKSVLLNGLLHSLKGKIPLIYVFSATAIADKSSDLKILTPISFIYAKWDLKVVKKIMDYNEIRQSKKELSFNLGILYRIFTKFKSIISTCPNYENCLKLIKNQIKIIKDKHSDDEVKEEANTKIIMIYRRLIQKKYNQIIKCTAILKTLEPEELTALQYMNKNIEIAIIFNDFGNEQAAMKKKSEDFITFNNLYTRGRHFHMTSFNLIQSKSQSSDLILSSAHLTFFTDVGAASGFFRRRCFSNELQKKYSQISEGILLSPEHSSKFLKVMYNKTAKNSEIACVHSDTIKPFRFTHDNYWKALKDKEKDVKDMVSPDNSFKFKVAKSA